jgi:hypothetical protein
MSVRLIAIELYQKFNKVEALKKEFETASPKRRVLLAGELRKAEAEYRYLRKVLNGQKETKD